MHLVIGTQTSVQAGKARAIKPLPTPLVQDRGKPAEC